MAPDVNLAADAKAGLWHLVTNCHPAAGTVGLASLGVLGKTTSQSGTVTSGGGMSWGGNDGPCTAAMNVGTGTRGCNSGTGVSSKTYSTWLVIAHEIGHNFGANHNTRSGDIYNGDG